MIRLFELTHFLRGLNFFPPPYLFEIELSGKPNYRSNSHYYSKIQSYIMDFIKQSLVRLKKRKKKTAMA